MTTASHQPSAARGAAALSTDGSRATSAKHWCVFYETTGIAELPPPVLHYLNLGCWNTTTCDFYLHRRPRKGEEPGQSVVWLHNAQPRDRFVFLISPVMEPGAHSFRAWLWGIVYGKPPPFSFPPGVSLLRQAIQRRSAEAAKSKSRRVGVEVVEVLHADLTAMDYAPGLTSSRLALETRCATCRWFDSRAAALAHYGCTDINGANAAPFMTPQLSHAGPTHAPGTPAPLRGGGARSQIGEDAGDGSSKATSPQLTSQRSSVVACSSPSSAPGPLGTEPVTFQLPPSVADQATRLQQGRSDTPRPPEPIRSASTGSGGVCGVGSSLSDKGSETTSPCTSGAPASAPVADDTREQATGPLNAVYTNTMVIVCTQDPHFNAVLREVLIPESGTHPFARSLDEQRRLLSMYETGMPSWPIFFSRYGLPYRRWFRLLAVAIVNTWPLIALFVGLYDLYKHMPYLKDWLADVLLPFTTWMEQHFTLRISMLVTYLLSVTLSIMQSLHSFVKSGVAILTFVLSPIYPLLEFVGMIRHPLLFVWRCLLGPVFAVGSGAVHFLFLTIWMPFRLLWYGLKTATGVRQVTQSVENASLLALWWRSWLEFWDKVARPIKNLAKACYDGVVHVGVALARREASLRRWYTSKVIALTAAAHFALSECLNIAYYNIVFVVWQLPLFRALWQMAVVAALTSLVMVLRAGAFGEITSAICESPLSGILGGVFYRMCGTPIVLTSAAQPESVV